MNQQQLSWALCQARAAAALAFGDLQVQLVRELLTRLTAHGAPAARTVPVQASLDQLEASLRQLRALGDATTCGTSNHPERVAHVARPEA